MLFTHGTWQNIFHGYPVDFGKIVIEDDAWLPWHVTVLPNVVIGKGATIGAGSLVTKDVPPYSLAVGIPAKVIKNEGYPKQLSLNEKHAVATNVVLDFVEYMRDFKGAKIKLHEKEPLTTIIDEATGKELVYCRAIQSPKVTDKTLVSFSIPESYWKNNDCIDLDQETMSIKEGNFLAQEFVRFIRRYGVRPITRSL